MLDTMFHVWSEEIDIHHFVNKYSISKDEYWVKGIKDTVGRVRTHSGFKFLISDNEDVLEHFSDLKTFLISDKELITELKEKNMNMCFNVGMTFNVSKYYSKNFTFTNDILKVIADAGIDIEISTYVETEEE